MTIIAVTAAFQFKADQLNIALTILKSIIAPSRKEPGCLFYELYRDSEQEDTYVMIERWQSVKDWQHHLQAPHIVHAAQEIQSCLMKPIVVRSFSYIA